MSWKDWPIYSAECRRDVQRLLRDGTGLTAYKANPKHGPEPRYGSWAWKLERESEKIHQVRHVIACSSGTVALQVLLKSLYLGGDEIVTSAFTFSATIGSILLAGLTPIFADVFLPTGTLQAESATRMATKKTVDFLAVDLFGCQAGFVGSVTDSCQAVGLNPNHFDPKQQVFHGVWSFNGRKNVPAGEGGAIFTNDVDVAERCRLTIGHAENFGKFPEWVSGNGHMNEVTACIAYHGMHKVQLRNAHRTKMAKVLNDALACSPVITPDLTHHALYMYPLIVEHSMEQVADRLYQQGVQCQRGYIQPPLHKYPAFKHLRRDALPNTESLSQDRLLLFPQVTPTATRQEMEELGDKIRSALG